MDIHTQKEQFRKGIKKGPMSGNEWTFNKNSKALFTNAAYQAYLDAARTFHNVGDSIAKNTINTVFPKKLSEYFSNPAPKGNDEFDFFHASICDALIKEFLSNGFDATYGQAQKIVNMTFKYLYCCDGAPEEYFTYCHMPLDSFTLEWFKRNVPVEPRLVIGKMNSWSKLDNNDSDFFKDTDNKEYYTYSFYLKHIRNYIETKGLNYSPLELEFFEWPKIQMELAAEGFLFGLEEDPNKGEIRNLSLEAKYQRIMNELKVRGY